MRDLITDLKELTTRHDYRTDYSTQLEWLNRAIEAEENWKYLHNEIMPALREENDIQRASIQQLSAQAAGLRRVLKSCATVLSFAQLADNNGQPLLNTTIETMTMIHKALSQPDPGAKYRAVVEAAKDVCKECREEAYSEGWDIVCEVRDTCEFHKVGQALASLEGGD